MGWSLFRVPQSLTGDPKATRAVRDRGAQEFSRRRSQSFPSLLGVESSDDGAAAPRPAGGGDGSCDPPTGSADGCACRAGGTRGSCRRSRTSPLGGAPVWWRRGLAAGWGCRCLSTPSEPVHFRLFRPCRTTRRILCVVCRRQWSKLGLKGSEGTFGRREDIEMLIATGTSRGTTGISECPPFSAYSSFSFCLSVYAQGCVLCTGVWVEASACVWQRGCSSSRRSATPTRRRSWRGQVALAANLLFPTSPPD